MIQCYFLDGLGSNAYYVSELRKDLAAQQIELAYLPLPGHPNEESHDIRDLEAFKDWFQEKNQ